MLLWVLFFASVTLGGAQDKCGGLINQRATGSISSPNYPQFYPDVITCIWEILAPPNHRVRLDFHHFDVEESIECIYDRVEIYSINSDGTAVLKGKFCGVYLPDPILSDDNFLRVWFLSDTATSRNGFNATFTVIRDDEIVPSTMPTINNAPPRVSRSSDNSFEERSKLSKIMNLGWLQNRIKRSKASELPRAILAFYLADPSTFKPGNKTSSELKDKLTIQILAQMSRNTTIRSQELALYVQALMVTCQDPRDFFGRDLVSELRARVDQPSSYTNPFEILALCNAGGSVTTRDVEKVSAAFDSQNKPFWTDVQALATMAMQCLSSKVTVDERTVRDMQDELKKRQFSNGTVDNLATTALVVQALSRNGSSVEFFNLTSALEVLLKSQGEDRSWGGSVRNSFYILPALSGRSFLDIGHAHCPKTTESEEESLARLQESGGEDTFVVQYTVWLGSDVDLGRTWRLRVRSNVSFYDVLEKVSKLDSRHNVSYQVVDGKPYVRSLLGKEDDPELGIFWFVYVRPASSTQPPTLLESSPADVLVDPNQEFILWYKPNNWKEDGL